MKERRAIYRSAFFITVLSASTTLHLFFGTASSLQMDDHVPAREECSGNTLVKHAVPIINSQGKTIGADSRTLAAIYDGDGEGGVASALELSAAIAALNFFRILFSGGQWSHSRFAHRPM